MPGPRQVLMGISVSVWFQEAEEDRCCWERRRDCAEDEDWLVLRRRRPMEMTPSLRTQEDRKDEGLTRGEMQRSKGLYL